MNSNTSHKTKLNLLQAFRGLAAFLVVSYHIDLVFNRQFGQNFLFGIFSFGHAGVDFFFVLSGFIIFYVHQNDIGNPEKFSGFLQKRFVRIYPFYWFALIAKLLASYHPSLNLTATLKAFLLFPQEHSILESNFIGLSWTLSFEIFFYLFFSLLILLGYRRGFPIVLLWISIVLLNFFGLISGIDGNFLLKFLFNPYHLEFFSGCLIAFLLTRFQFEVGKYFLYLGLFLFTLTAINTNLNFLEISNVIAYGIPSIMLIIGSVSLEKKRAVLVPHPFFLMGDASYAIYLTHYFILTNFMRAVNKIDVLSNFSTNPILFLLFSIATVSFVLVIGTCFHLYIEKPIFMTSKKILLKSHGA